MKKRLRVKPMNLLIVPLGKRHFDYDLRIISVSF